MQCDSCSTEMKVIHNQNYFHCIRCKRYQFPTEMADSVDPIVAQYKSVEANCPKCDINLQVGILHDRWNVCYCENCRGFLIEKGALQVATHELRANYKGNDDQPRPIDPTELDCRRICPACLDPFETHSYFGPGNVIIDSCQPCGMTWMDHGELGMIIRAPGKRPDPNSSPVVPRPTLKPQQELDHPLGQTTRFVIQQVLQFGLC